MTMKLGGTVVDSYAKKVFEMKHLTPPDEAELVKLDNEWEKFQQMKRAISPDILQVNDIFYRYEKEKEEQ